MICIYHHGCLDGFAAAWVTRKANPNTDIEFIPARYGDDPPDVTDQIVYIVDFSYPRETLLAMAESAKEIVVLDHHKSARENLAGLLFAHFDLNKAGCLMTWEYFFPNKISPVFIELISDRDLWRFERGDITRQVNAAIFSYPFDFEVWDTFESAHTLYRLRDEGVAILRDRQRRIDSFVSGWAICRSDIGGYDVPMLNCPRYLASDTLNILAEGEPFAASYFDNADKREFSLRSAPDGVDVSEIARMYGGGGHKHAAGFTVDKPGVLQGQEKELLTALETVSEQLAEWSLNKGPLDYGNGHLSNQAHQELERLEAVLENAIVQAGGQW